MSPQHVVTRFAQRAAAALATSALALSLVVGASPTSVLAAPADAPVGPKVVIGSLDFHTYGPGATVNTPIVVRNDGTQMARSVEVKVTPIGFDTISVEGNGWACRPHGDPNDGFFGSVLCTAQELAPNEVLSLTFRGKKHGAKAKLAVTLDPRNMLGGATSGNTSFTLDY